jgi:hypothetical protein
LQKKFEKKINNLITKNVERFQQRKTLMSQEVQFLVFFVINEPFKKIDVQQKDFLQDLVLLIMENNLPLQLLRMSS